MISRMMTFATSVANEIQLVVNFYFLVSADLAVETAKRRAIIRLEIEL